MRIKEILKQYKECDDIAVIDSQTTISYRLLHANVLSHVKAIREYMKGNNVGIFLQNSVDYVEAFFTITYSDKVIVPIEINISFDKIFSIISYCELKLIITNNCYFQELERAILEKKVDVTVYNIQTQTGYVYGKRYDAITKEKEKDVAIMLHTSGTTSNPKKVMLTHKNLISNIQSNIASLELNSKDRSLIVLPMCFGYCNTSQFLTHFYMGGSIVIYDGTFVPSRFFHYLDKYQCTNTTCIPSMLYLITRSKRVRYPLTSLRYLCFGGGTISLDVLEKVNKILPHVGIVQTYGQTEASPRVTCLLPQDAERKIGSVGKAIPGVSVKVVDENGKELSCNSTGEIVVKGDNVMKGYYKRPEETAKTIRKGWLHTGDIGMFDEEGYLYIVGRIKNVIITGGLNIYPEEIEEVLRSYPDIDEALVLPQQHEVLGEVPMAQVVLKENANINNSDLMKFCKEKLEIQKIPSEIFVVDKLEKTYNGKIRRVNHYDNK